MVDKIEETVHYKTPGLSKLETYVLTHNRFNTYLVSIFSDLNEAQIYKMVCRVSSHDEIEMLLNFKYLKIFKPHEHTLDYHNRKPNDENSLFKIGDKKKFMWEKK